jgi:glutathione peroxidase
MCKEFFMSESIYDFNVTTIDGQSISLKNYEGKTLLIVNTASQCGFTSQYQGLQDLYEKYKDKNFVVLGFPCNQFGAQEPGNEAEIKQFCELNYHVNFPLFSKVDVNGDSAHPLFKFLKSNMKGFLGTEFIKWNFTKFLVDKQGNLIKRFAPQDKPQDLESEIKELL